jgi:hypothetical protein
MPKIELTDEQLKKLEALLGESLDVIEEKPAVIDPQQLAAKHALGPSTRGSPCGHCGRVHTVGEDPLLCRCFRCGEIKPISRRRGTVVSLGMTAGVLCEGCREHGF